MRGGQWMKKGSEIEGPSSCGGQRAESTLAFILWSPVMRGSKGGRKKLCGKAM
jgi:hypothetical protein